MLAMEIIAGPRFIPLRQTGLSADEGRFFGEAIAEAERRFGRDCRMKADYETEVRAGDKTGMRVTILAEAAEWAGERTGR